MKEETGINRSGLEAACQDRAGTLPENGQMIDLQLTVANLPARLRDQMTRNSKYADGVFSDWPR